MIALLAAHAVVGTALIALGARLGRRAFLVAALPMTGAALWAVAKLHAVEAGVAVHERARWVSGLGLGVDLHLDGLSLTMTLVVSLVGVAVLLYSAQYFPPDAPDLGRLAGLLVLFGGSMLGLVQADHLLVLYTCWELTSITSFLLIGNRHTEARARAAALHALLVTSAGGLGMLAGILVLAEHAGTFRLSGLVANPPSGPAVSVAVMLVLFGAFTKSAQYPFHAWLPGAMAAPTPVSAYLHSATMVKAGVVLVASLAPAFADVPGWRPVVLTAGCTTMVLGGLRALRQHDLKLLLAFGTVSQLGLLIVLFGVGTPAAAAAGWVMLVAHAAFKATLFMIVGIIDHQTGTRDLRELPVLGHEWRPVQVVTALALVSMAGIPLGAGFVGKELAYEALASGTMAGSRVVLAIVVAGSMLTVAYSARFFWGAFILPRKRTASADGSPVPPPALRFLAPAAALSAIGIVVGIAPALANRLASASLSDFADAEALHLGLWHGLGLPLTLSALTLAGGALLAFGDRRVQPVLAWGGRIPSGAEAYLASLRVVGTTSARVTGFVQSGSLPVYAGVILATAAAAPGIALLVGRSWAGWPPLGAVQEVPVAIVLLVAAVGAASVRRRFSAAVFLGVCGYAMAGLFVLSGAPDLALTQVAVETLSTVVFVLVLRRLPERFERQSSARRRIGRLAISAAVGASVFAFALTASGYRLPSTVSDEMVARAVPDGHGRNVVNVILVDFRGFDTLGEISVLAVASIGAVALARVGRRQAEERGEVVAPASAPRRLPFVDVSVRVVFHVVLMTSLWLLFAGHNQPGGGFVGGLLAGSAIALRFVAGGMAEVRGQVRFRPWTVLGTGLLLAGATALIPLATGDSVLEVAVASLTLPIVGDVKVSSALAFDTGVYLAVVGMVLMAFEAFGDEPAGATT